MDPFGVMVADDASCSNFFDIFTAHNQPTDPAVASAFVPAAQAKSTRYQRLMEQLSAGTDRAALSSSQAESATSEERAWLNVTEERAEASVGSQDIRSSQVGGLVGGFGGLHGAART